MFAYKRVLLHCCCAPCSCAVIESLLRFRVDPHIYFYNPNIHPQEEYEHRKAEVVRYAARLGIAYIDEDYDVERWFDLVKGREADPERGQRCSICFEMRLEKTAAFAVTHGFKVFATTISISRWKNFEQVTLAGHHVAGRFPGLTYWDCNWRKNGGSERMEAIAKEEQFYRQQYCGCACSQRHAKSRFGS